MWEKTYLSISERFCILGQKTQSLGQDFVAARCLPVRDIKGTECKTVVAGCRSIDTAELQPRLSCPPNPTQNALREHQLAQPGYSALLWQCTSVGLYKTLPFVHNPACDEAFFCRLQSESSVTCQALLASEDAQRAIKPHLVSPMFKCMESQSVHVIEIIKNGYNPTENPEPIFWVPTK